MVLPLSGSEHIFDPRDYTIIGFNCYDYAIGYQDKRNNKAPHPQKSSPGERAKKPVQNLKNCNEVRRGILSDNPKKIYASKATTKCKNGFFKMMCFIAPDKGDGNADFHFYRQVKSCRYKILAGNTVNGLAKYFHVRPAVIIAAAKKLKSPTNNSDGNINSNSNESNKNMQKNMNNAKKSTYDTMLKPGRIIEFPCNLWAHKQGWGTRPKIVDAAGETITDPRKCMRNYSAQGGMNYKVLCGVYCVSASGAKSGSNSGTVRNVKTFNTKFP
jgi:hypothetical protein